MPLVLLVAAALEVVLPLIIGEALPAAGEDLPVNGTFCFTAGIVRVTTGAIGGDVRGSARLELSKSEDAPVDLGFEMTLFGVLAPSDSLDCLTLPSSDPVATLIRPSSEEPCTLCLSLGECKPIPL